MDREDNLSNCGANRHLGHIFLECMKRSPDDICQIDAATGEEETNASVLNRSVRLARCFRRYGLQPGDVLSLAGRNHLDLHIPYYAALLIGLPISAVDSLYRYNEIKSLFSISRPKIAFCQKETYNDHAEAIKSIGLDTKLVTFESGENSMEKFLETYDTDESIDDFKSSEFDLDKVYGFLVTTSGTTGKHKLAAMKHRVLISRFNRFIELSKLGSSGLTNISLIVSPMNWISSFFFAIAIPMTKHIKLQTSNPDDIDHLVDLINKYKPVSTLISPAIMASLINRKEDVDLKCFRSVTITGSKIHLDIIAQFRALLHKDAIIIEGYGMTETIGACLAPNVKGLPGSCGRRMPSYQVKLMDPDTGKEITDANTPGELWVKGEMFTEFYNDPEETNSTFTEDGFYKTGDLLYRDENDNFFYIDRLKSLMKYRNYHILPGEIEDVIRTHPAVRAVCVCGIPHPEDGQRPVACIVLHENCHVTAQEIKDLVASKLSKNKQLRGGVVFLDKLPMTSTGKIIFGKLPEVISQLPIE